VVAAVEAGLDRLGTVGQDAVMGERWVEMVGLRAQLEGAVECWRSLVSTGQYRCARPLWSPAHRTGASPSAASICTVGRAVSAVSA